MADLTFGDFDDLCARELAAEADKERAEKQIKDLKAQIEKLVRKHGSSPEGADKSLRLAGAMHVSTVTFPTSTSIDKEAVEKLEEQLGARTFLKIFHVERKFIVAPTAAETVAKFGADIKRLFAKCTKSKPGNPRVSVEKVSK